VVFTLKFSQRSLSKEIVSTLGRLLSALIILLLILVVVDKLTHLYSPNRDATVFLLTGRYSPLFWVGQVGLAYVIPLIILFHPKARKTIKWIMIASALVVIGIFFERFVLVIPGLAYPLPYYPGHIEGIWGTSGLLPSAASRSNPVYRHVCLPGSSIFLGLEVPGFAAASGRT